MSFNFRNTNFCNCNWNSIDSYFIYYMTYDIVKIFYVKKCDHLYKSPILLHNNIFINILISVRKSLSSKILYLFLFLNILRLHFLKISLHSFYLFCQAFKCLITQQITSTIKKYENKLKIILNCFTIIKIIFYIF